MLVNGNRLVLKVSEYSQSAGVTDLGTAGGQIFAPISLTRMTFTGGF